MTNEPRPVSFWVAELNKTTAALRRGPSKIVTERVHGTTKRTDEYVDVGPIQHAADRARSITSHLIPRQAEMTPHERAAFRQASLRHGRALLGHARDPKERAAVEAWIAGIGR